MVTKGTLLVTVVSAMIYFAQASGTNLSSKHVITRCAANSFDCSSFNGCYTGSPLTSCPTGSEALVQTVPVTRYRLTRAVGYNMPKGNSQTFHAFELTFSHTVPGSQQPDLVCMFGSKIGHDPDSTQTITFSSEIMALGLS